MIVVVKTTEKDIVAIQAHHVVMIQVQEGGECEITMINNKRILVNESYLDLVQKLNVAR